MKTNKKAFLTLAFMATFLAHTSQGMIQKCDVTLNPEWQNNVEITTKTVSIDEIDVTAKETLQKNSQLPYITAFWSDNPEGKRAHLQSRYLEDVPIFGSYNEKLLNNHRLPKKIPYRYEPKKDVSAKTLGNLIENCITEICNRDAQPEKKEFTNFTILKDLNFNYTTHAGLMILKSWVQH